MAGRVIQTLFRLLAWALLALVFLGVVRLARHDAAPRSSSGSAVSSAPRTGFEPAGPSAHVASAPTPTTATTTAATTAATGTPSAATNAAGAHAPVASRDESQGHVESPAPKTPEAPRTTASTPQVPAPVVGSVPRASNRPQHPDRNATHDPNERADGSVFDRDLGVLPAGPGPEYEGLGVMCVHHVTQRRLGGVSVRWALQADLDAWLARNPGRRLEDVDSAALLDEIFPKTSRPATSVDGGVALTPSAPGRILVDARQGALYGFAWVDRNRSPRARIEMVEDRDLFLRVRAAPGDAGAPGLAGVPVVVRDSSCVEIWRGTTSGEEGVARMRHAGFVIARDASPGPCMALVDGVVPSARAFTVNAGELPLSEVDLPLARCGRVEVVVKDEHGERVRGPHVVRLSSPGADACERVTARVAVDGRATFEFVEELVPLNVTADGLDEYESVTFAARGPDSPTSPRTLECSFRRRLPSVRVHLVEAPAVPVVDARGTAWLEYELDGRAYTLPARRDVVTDGDGHAAIVFDVPPADARRFALFVALKNRFGDWYSSGRRELGLDAFDHAVDLGRFEVTEMPTLAAGYVLDDRGSPVGGAWVELSHADDPALAPEEFALDARWTTTADDLGRFRLRGFVDGARLALSASAPEHVRPERREIPRGERKISLTLPRTSSIVGKILLPERMPIDDVRIWVESAGEVVPGLIGANGSYRVAQIAPGEAALRVLVAGFDEPVYEVPNLTARPGTDINDANVATIDLRPRLSFLSVYVLAPGDVPVEKGVAVVREEVGDEVREREVPLRSGFASFYARSSRVDVEIRAPGFATKALVGVDRDTEVRLEPTPR